MQTLLTLFRDLFSRAIKQAFPAEFIESDLIEITPSTSEKFGHYQCNSAMKLAKMLQQPPRAVAQAIVTHLEHLPSVSEWVEKLEIAGPGFINMTVRAEYLAQRVNSMLHEPYFDLTRSEKKEKIVVDFSSPNVAKEMHVGHLRSTVIGDSLCRLFEFYGDDVLRLNHLGDWGTAFGMLIAYMKEEHADVLKGTRTCELSELMEWYKASKKRFDEDEEFKKRSQLEVVALQSGEPDSQAAWNKIVDISRRAYCQIYQLLDVKIIDRGESFYNPLLKALVHDLDVKGLVTISDGAKCVYLEGFKNREGELLPLMVQKSDGGFNYDTTDLAALRQRVDEEKADRLIYVTDQGQGNHFAMIFKAGENAGYVDPKKVRLDHVGFGLVLGADGKKFKTRSGEVEKLIDLLTTAISHAKKIISERTPELSAEEQEKNAIVLGINAVKYADLSCNRHHDYVFSYDKMLRFEGNTASFLLYAYVRILSIKRRVAVPESVLAETAIVLTHPSEINLALHLCRFGETLEQMKQDLLPNHLTDYLYNLAEYFNAFFRDCRVEGSPEQNSRWLLCDLTARLIQQGFDILGLKTLERM
ncbi:MAG: arginine--tRNA ligase [Gammaproteobacteria bacterium]|nr:arginine--tRNA ligase [Gammaproteobacteria bacterium]